MGKKNWLGMLVMMLVFTVVLAGCATLTWNTPVTESGSRSALETAERNAGGIEVANYTILFGFIPLGRGTFDGLVVAAARSGKSVDILRSRGLFTTKIVAYARD